MTFVCYHQNLFCRPPKPCYTLPHLSRFPYPSPVSPPPISSHRSVCRRTFTPSSPTPPTPMPPTPRSPPDTQPADCRVAVAAPREEDAVGPQGNAVVESYLRWRHALTTTSPPRLIPLPRAMPHRPCCLTAETAAAIQQTPEHCQHGGAAHTIAWISLYIEIEKRKKKNSNCVGSYGESERATEQRATERKSDGATERQIDRATERRATERRSDRTTEQRSERG